MNIKVRKIIIVVALMCLCVSVLFITSYASNETSEKIVISDVKMEFVANNVSYSDSLYILYAISNEGFDRTMHEIKMLFWDEAQENYVLGTEKYSVSNSGTAKIKGKNCLVFYSNGIAAKEMTDDIFARACVVIDGIECYTDVMKFSVLEYVHAMKEQGNIGNGQIKLFTSMLEYGTNAQNSFDHNTSRPANGNYFKVSISGGKLPDGFDSGRYLVGDKVVITHNEPGCGMRFSHWIDENGIIVSFDKTLEITMAAKSKEYTAVYKDVSNVVAQLMLKTELPYNGTIDDIDLPTAVQFEINGETVTLDVTWDLGSFETSKIGKQNIHADLVDTSAYATYGIEPGSIVLEVNTLPFAYELDSSNGEYIVAGYYGDAESITIPTTYRNIYISRIATGAFNRAMTLKEVIIPNTVKKIDNGAFFYCDNIEKMTLPFIGESENSSNSWLGWIFGAEQYDIQHGRLPLKFYSVTLRDGAIKVPNYAFYKCSQITEFNIPDTVKYISSGAFEYCTGLTEFTIPSSLINVSGQFFGCTNLKRVNTSSLDSLFNISFNKGGMAVGPLSYGADLYCNGNLVNEVRIPEGVNQVYLILQGCRSVEKITIPSSVKYFSIYAFYNMKSLKEVVFENPTAITELSSGLFSGCSSIVSFDLSEFASLKTLNSSVFFDCKALQSVKLPEGLTDIGSYTFTNTAIKTITLPKGIQKIPDYCFQNCNQLESIMIPDGVIEIGAGAFIQCTSLSEVAMPVALTTICSDAFYNCDKLTVVALPERVYEIQSRAFYDCNNLAKLIIRSERLNNIGSSAFNGCTNLYEIFNLSSLNITVGSEEFGRVGYYAKVIHTTLDETSQVTVDEDGFVIYTNDIENIIIGYVGTAAEIVIPALDNGKSTAIAENLFYFNSLVTKITISEGVSRIESNAFYYCTNLETVIIPNSVSSIKESAFGACGSLTIYCETASQPEGWNSTWNSSNRPVVWEFKSND